MKTICILLGIANCVLIGAHTLGVFGELLGIPYGIMITITGFMRKTFFPDYFSLKIAHMVSCLAMAFLIFTFTRKEINIILLIIGLAFHTIWMVYYELLLLN